MQTAQDCTVAKYASIINMRFADSEILEQFSTANITINNTTYLTDKKKETIFLLCK